jgi:hypothetical protein
MQKQHRDKDGDKKTVFFVGWSFEIVPSLLPFTRLWGKPEKRGTEEQAFFSSSMYFQKHIMYIPTKASKRE